MESGENGGEVEETNPNLLRNTPSNIARLEDAIEQCEGRHKYLAHTRSPSDGGDVRWYFCKVFLAENELSASVPRAEIVGKSEYFRFGMRDSLAIEASFLQREEELLSSWWREYAECSEGPKERPSSSSKSGSQSKASSSGAAPSIHYAEEERVGVPVKGGLYEVDLVKRHCFPVYWNGEDRRVLRGHWFARKGGLDWLPLREDVSEQLEFAYSARVWHRRTFQSSGLFAARVDLQGSTPGLHALFTGEDDTWEAWLNVDASGFSSVISIGGNGIKLRRGYSPPQSTKPSQDELRQQKEEEMDDYCSQVPVRHVVFMVHGIGQRLQKSNLVDDVGTFHHITVNLSESHLTSHQRNTQRVLFIPCQWRRGLKLSGEKAVERCTLDGVRGLRVMLSATVHDVLYYMSPIYCQDIINSVSNQLNRLYLKFLKRNPGYDGKVSIYGHSLGSVLSYDILCHQTNLSSPFPMDWMYKEHDTNEERPIHLEDMKSISNGTKDVVDFNNENNHLQPTLSVIEEECAEDSSITDNLVATSDLEDPKETNGFSRLEEDVHEPTCNHIDVIPQERDGLDEATSIYVNGVSSEIMVEEVCDSNSEKEKTIELLREEIDSLQARIAELETQRGAKDTDEEMNQGNKVHLSLLKQPISEISEPEKVETAMSYTPYIKYTKLAFKVDTFFAVGSPLGVFLSLRNIRIGIGKGQEYWGEENVTEEMPACRQMLNIFHPFDPVAYRVEPLISKEYIGSRPVIIPYHRGGKRLHIGFQDFTEDLAARSQVIVDHFNSVRVKVLTVCQSRNNRDSIEDADENSREKEEKSYGSMMMERITGGSLEGRVDHMLQDKTFEHQYISALGSHTNYWRDYDTALFILKHLYQDIAEDPNSPNEESVGGGSKDGSESTGTSGQRVSSEEDLPLTFANRLAIRNFSRKAKKTSMKL